MLLSVDATGVWSDALPLCLDIVSGVEVLDLLDDVHTEERVGRLWKLPKRP